MKKAIAILYIILYILSEYLHLPFKVDGKLTDFGTDIYLLLSSLGGVSFIPSLFLFSIYPHKGLIGVLLLGITIGTFCDFTLQSIAIYDESYKVLVREFTSIHLYELYVIFFVVAFYLIDKSWSFLLLWRRLSLLTLYISSKLKRQRKS